MHSRLLQLTEFCNFYFSHPSIKDSPLLRVKGLVNKKLNAPRHIETTLKPTNFTSVLPKLLEINDKQVDMYYAIHRIRDGLARTDSFNTADILRRLYYVIDIDYKLPCPIGDVVESLGLTPNAIITTSTYPHPKYHLLFTIADTLLPDHELNAFNYRLGTALGSDALYDLPRIFRLPGTYNWKPYGRGLEVDNSLAVLNLASHDKIYSQEELEYRLNIFEKTNLSQQLKELHAIDCTEPTATKDRTKRVNRGHEYFHYTYVLERAEVGIPTVLKGARHYAIMSWIGQTQALLPTEQQRIIDILCAKGCFPAADTPADKAHVNKMIAWQFKKKDEERDALQSLLDEAPVIEVSSLSSLEKEQDLQQTIALANFRDSFFDFIVNYKSGSIDDNRVPVLVGKLVAAITLGMRNNSLFMVEFLHKAFEYHDCNHGNYYSGKTIVETVWRKDKATVRRQLTRNELAAIVQAGAMKLRSGHAVSVIRSLCDTNPVTRATIKAAGWSDFSEIETQFPATVEAVTTCTRGLSINAADSLGKIQPQPAHIIVFQNGIFNLKSGKFTVDLDAPMKHTNPIMANYVEESVETDSYWNTFLLRAFKYIDKDGVEHDDWGTIELLYRMFAHCMTTDTSCQKIFVLKGKTQTGKSTILSLLAALIGRHSYGRGQFDNMATDFAFADCENKTTYFIEESQSKDHAKINKVFVLLKEATGGTELLVNEKHVAPRVIKVTFKPVLTANDNFSVNDPGGAILRRLVVIKTNNTVLSSDVKSPEWILDQMFADGSAHRIASEAARRLSAAIRADGGNIVRVFDTCGSHAYSEGNKDAGEILQGAEGVLKDIIEVCSNGTVPSLLIRAVQIYLCESMGIYDGGKNQLRANKEVIADWGRPHSEQCRLEGMEHSVKFGGFKGVQLKDSLKDRDIDWNIVLRFIETGGGHALTASKQLLKDYGFYSSLDSISISD